MTLRRLTVGKTCRRVLPPATVLVVLTLILVAVASCAVPVFGPPPVEYGPVEVVMGDRGALHSLAGVYYTIANRTDRDVTHFEIAFSLFDADERPFPGFGSNSFSVTVASRLARQRTASFCTSIDDVFAGASQPVSVARFRVRRVTFADGTVWTNPGVLTPSEGGQ